MNFIVNKHKLYRLPWTSVDNVNGWIEPTYRCNLNCRGCYRRKWKESFTLEEMKATVDETVRIRNCDHITIAGGEPLLVDYLEDLVRYIKRIGRKVSVLSNGVFLDEYRLKSLKQAGLDRMTLHIDSGQNRPDWEGKDEIELLALKKEYAELINAYDIQFGIISVIYENTYRYLPDVIQWAMKNSAQVNSLTFDLFRYYPSPEYINCFFTPTGQRVELDQWLGEATSFEENRLTIDDLYNVMVEVLPGFTPHSFLNGTGRQDVIKWLLSTLVIQEGEVLGYIGSRTTEFVNSVYHYIKGRHPSFVGSRLGYKFFLTAMIDSSVRAAFKNYLSKCIKNPVRFFRKPNLLTITFVQPCEWYTDSLQSFCDGCPDAMLYDGILIPSCRLDEYKAFGSHFSGAEFKEGISIGHRDLNEHLIKKNH